MKKVYSFLLLVSVLFVFSCTLPKEIEVRGSTSTLKFGAAFDFGQMLTDMITESFSGNDDVDEFEIIECNADTRTYIIYMKLFEEELQSIIDDKLAGYLSGSYYNVGSDVTLLEKNIDAINLEGLNDVINGFEFTGIKSKLFVSGSDIVEHLAMNIDIDNESIIDEAPLSGFDKDEESGFNQDVWKDYKYFSELSGGHEVDIDILINGDGNAALDIDVFVKSGEIIPVGLVTTGIMIKAELVIWIPMELKPVGTEDNPDEAELKFPKDAFEDIGGFIESVSEYVESMTITVGMNNNPFEEGYLVMSQPDTSFKITNPLNDKSLIFKVSPSDMKQIINYGSNFKPVVSIKFDKNNTSKITIPKDVDTTHVSLNAKLSYTIDLGGE